MPTSKTNKFWASLEKEAKKNNPKSFWWWKISLIGWFIGISVLLTYFCCSGMISVDTIPRGILFGIAVSLNVGCSMFLYMLVVMALSERKLIKKE